MKKWTDEIDSFIRERIPCKDSVDKTLLLLAINERFGTHFTMNAFTTHLVDKRMDCGLHHYNRRENRNRPNFNQRPLFSERKKKGMWQVKVAQPNVWKQKNVWVYEQYNKCIVPKGCKVIFLNTNKEDFSPDNLYMITQAELGTINRHFNGFSADKDESMSRILQAKIMLARHQRAKENGLLNSSGNFRNEAHENYLRYKNDPVKRKRMIEYSMEYNKKKMQDPAYRAEVYRQNNIRRIKKRLENGQKVFESTRRKYGL